MPNVSLIQRNDMGPGVYGGPPATAQGVDGSNPQSPNNPKNNDLNKMLETLMRIQEMNKKQGGGTAGRTGGKGAGSASTPQGGVMAPGGSNNPGMGVEGGIYGA